MFVDKKYKPFSARQSKNVWIVANTKQVANQSAYKIFTQSCDRSPVYLIYK